MITVYPKRYINNELVPESIEISRPFSVVTYTDKEEIALIKGWIKEVEDMNKTLEYYNDNTDYPQKPVDVEDYVMYQLKELDDYNSSYDENYF